jgi:hypothetical protein
MRKLGCIHTFDWTQGDPGKATSSLYSCKFVRPGKQAIIACGVNRNAAKVFSLQTGEMLFDITSIDPVIGISPLITVDTSPVGKSILIGSSNGQIHVKDLHITLLPNPATYISKETVIEPSNRYPT